MINVNIKLNTHAPSTENKIIIVYQDFVDGSVHVTSGKYYLNNGGAYYDHFCDEKGDEINAIIIGWYYT